MMVEGSVSPAASRYSSILLGKPDAVACVQLQLKAALSNLLPVLKNLGANDTPVLLGVDPPSNPAVAGIRTDNMQAIRNRLIVRQWRIAQLVGSLLEIPTEPHWIETHIAKIVQSKGASFLRATHVYVARCLDLLPYFPVLHEEVLRLVEEGHDRPAIGVALEHAFVIFAMDKDVVILGTLPGEELRIGGTRPGNVLLRERKLDLRRGEALCRAGLERVAQRKRLFRAVVCRDRERGTKRDERRGSEPEDHGATGPPQ